MKYKAPQGYVPSLPTTDEEAYHLTRWWLNHVESYGKNKAIGRGKGKARKELTPQQKAERKRFFIAQAQKNKKPNYGIPGARGIPSGPTATLGRFSNLCPAAIVSVK